LYFWFINMPSHFRVMFSRCYFLMPWKIWDHNYKSNYTAFIICS
jgi:hypothetical protein